MKRAPSSGVSSSEVSRQLDNTSYDVVKVVSLSIADVITVASNITELADIHTYIDEIVAVGELETEIKSIFADKAVIDSIFADKATLDSLVADKAALDAVALALAEIIINADNITDIVTTATDIVSVKTVADDIAAVLFVAANMADVTNFSDVYYGAKAVDPTVRNNGSAMLAGDIYFNTTISGIKAYNGTIWFEAYINPNEVLQVANNLDDLENVTTAKTNLSLQNVDNTSDANKPVSTAGQTALDLKVNNLDVIKAIGNINSPILDLPLKDSLHFATGSGTINFSRASTATYVDKYGVLKYAAIDEARFEKEGLLIEDSSTNEFTYSSDIRYWNKNGMTASFANDVSTVTEDTSTGEHFVSNPTSSTAGTVKTVSAIVKRTVGNRSLRIRCFDSVGFIGAAFFSFDTKVFYNVGTGLTVNVVEIADDTFILSVSFDSVNTNAQGSFYSIENGATSTTHDGDGVSSFEFIGTQNEKLPFASSYIPTTTAAVTRSADVVYVENIGNVPNTNIVDTSLALMCDFNLLGITGGSQTLMSQWGSSTNNWYMRNYTIDSRIGFYSEADSILTSLVGGEADLDLSIKRRFIFNIDAKIQSIYGDGVFLGSVIRNTDLMTNNLLSEKLYLGSIVGTTTIMYGHLANVKVYGHALTPTEASLA